MPTNRRQFIKQTFGAVTVGMIAPGVFINTARANPAPNREARNRDGLAVDANRRILVIIEFSGGNDGLNTVIPYADSRYASLRPALAFKDSELKDAAGRSMILSNQLGLHPAMSKIKGLYDDGKVAIISGVGYPNANGSHFESADIWHSAKVTDNRNDGWLGRYADLALVGRPGLSAIAVDDRLPKTFVSTNVVVPNIPNFDDYGLRTDDQYSDNRNNLVNTFLALHQRNFPADSFINAEMRIGFDAVNGALQFRSALDNYTSTVNYPDNNSLADGLQMIAQIITTMPESSLLYVQIGGFDTHSNQIASNNKAAGQHADLLFDFSEAVKAFYDDMNEHALADNVLLLQWSEFGRRPNENKSFGTDHGTASNLFVIGNAVHGGLYGRQPSLAVADLDDAGNLKFNVDFRSVYATILDKWLTSDSRAVLGGQFENLGFLG
jgi:uncharacterized protein (DUF1501 family)